MTNSNFTNVGTVRARWARRLALVGILAGAAGAACADEPVETLRGVETPSAGRNTEEQNATGGAIDEATAIAFLERECAKCHGIDKETGVKADYHSAWPLPAEGITRQFLEVNELTPNAYQTLRHAALDVDTAPAKMPPVVTTSMKSEIKRVIEWFQREVPYAVIDADARYGNESAAKEKVLLEFQCAKPSTLRTYLGRVTFGAFDRPPTGEELSLFSDAELAAAVTREQRDRIVARFDGPWREELLEVGVKKLATVVGGAPGINAGPGLSEEAAADLRQELYQSFLKRYDSATWDDYFTTTTVMATKNTAKLYGCTMTEDGWKECPLQPPRGSFFTTLGFLNSRPQSFLLENNNHGRVAALFFTLYGESLLAATAGPSGDETPALPACLENVDTRTFRGAPRGAAAVPAFGQVCQSCHVSRHMAAGAILFRRYSTRGLLYNSAFLGEAGSPDEALLAGAVDAAWKFRPPGASVDVEPTQVDTAYLASLLRSDAKPCIATGKAASPYQNVGTVGELAAALIANRSSFARGFVRHAHRAFSNLTLINLEMSYRALEAFDQKQPKLPDLIKMYFATDTLACEADQ